MKERKDKKKITPIVLTAHLWFSQCEFDKSFNENKFQAT